MFRRLRLLSKILIIVVAMIFCSSFFAVVKAEDPDLQPTANDNLRVGLRSNTSIHTTDDGYIRVINKDKKMIIENYDKNFNLQNKKIIDMELEYWGGFYAGKDAYYIVVGKANTEENDNAEVIRVIKYSKKWKRLGAAKITGNTELFGGEVRYPFDYGCVEMYEKNGTLYIVTGHEGYLDPAYNQGHQGFLMIAVDEKKLTGEIIDSDLSHSFAQYINGKNNDLYVLEQSEGGRYTKLTKYDPKTYENVSIPVLRYGGTRTSARAVACYASVDDLAISSDNVLCLGTSIDQSLYDSVTSDVSHNIYLTVTPISDFSGNATTVKWLTDFKNDGKAFLGVNITKINDDRFLITWEENEERKNTSIDDTLSGYTLHYLFIDGNGDKISKEYTAAAPVSDCHPIVDGSKIVYCASNGNMVNFYTIDANNGDFSKRSYRVAGENSTWILKDGTLTVSGSGKIDIDINANYRFPVSSTRRGYSYSTSDNCWKMIRANVNKIVISDGITDIPDETFNYFIKMQELSLGKNVKTVGKEAFANCDRLEKVYVYSENTTFDVDSLWSGYLSTDRTRHIVYATIYCYKDSKADIYAKDNGIRYKYFVTGIALDNTCIIMDKGATKTVKATVTPEEAEDKKVTWTSSNTKVATVDDNGNVKAVDHGIAKITAKTSNGKKATCEVRVNFADVADAGLYYYKPVYWAAKNKIATGADGFFAPHNSCTREQAITFLWRMAGSPQPKSKVSGFKDVQNKNSYSYKAIMWGTEKGIITGADSVFAPNNTCTREQIVTMLWRLAGRPTPKSANSKFKDVQNKNSYSYKAILWASEKGITTGANGEFKPGKTCTRAEIVTFIYRYKNTVK